MLLPLQVTADGRLVGGATPTTLANPHGPGAVITVVGNGPNVSANIVGPHNDASDLWGILVVLAVIFVSIAATRWLFGRGRARTRPGGPDGAGRPGSPQGTGH
ncbi:MAG TPA: hypothetical protein VFN68_00760 [Acidimicrobiales bacterium]|nr:hypothetical protein [Acidimicrobiales bacterium]